MAHLVCVAFVSLTGYVCRGEGVLVGPVCSSFLSKKRKLHYSQKGTVTQALRGPSHFSQLPPRILHCSSDRTNHGIITVI